MINGQITKRTANQRAVAQVDAALLFILQKA
jgi:hypothetical protein